MTLERVQGPHSCSGFGVSVLPAQWVWQTIAPKGNPYRGGVIS